MIHFTADTHFGHSKIIKYCSRPFECVEHMNETLIGNWNEVVKPMDTVYVLGDFAMGDPRPYLKRLYGNIYLIPGDHDLANKWFKDDVKGHIHKVCHRDEFIVLCHYPILVWPRSHYGSWHLHGHNHADNLPFCPGKVMNVGVDLNSFYPVPWVDVAHFMLAQPENWNHVRSK